MSYQQLSILEAIAEKSFFNTINLTGGELTKAKAQTCLQDKRVLEIFNEVPFMLSPYEVHNAYKSKYSECPLTSIRRSITVLTKKGLLKKTDLMVMGNFGKRTHTWEAV